MSTQRLPEHIAPFKNARQSLSLQGVIALEGMERLAQSLVSTEGEVQVALTFGVDAQGVSYMQGHLKTEVEVLCQRCMEPMRAPIEVNVSVGFVTNDEQARSMSKEYEPYTLVDETVILADLIEDELILALPVVAMHPDQTCQPWFERSKEAEEASLKEEAEKKENPFAILSNLKRH